MEKEAIRRRADKVLATFGASCRLEPHIDAVRLARFFGFTVEETDAISVVEDSNVTVSADGSERKIVVNEVRKLGYKRFYIVRELCQYFLNAKEGEAYLHRTNSGMRDNADAEYMARCILMPADMVTAQYDRLKGDSFIEPEIEAYMSRMFRLPETCVRDRIVEACKE